MSAYLKIQKYKCRDGEVFSKLPGKLKFGMKVYFNPTSCVSSHQLLSPKYHGSLNIAILAIS